MDISTRIISV